MKVLFAISIVAVLTLLLISISIARYIRRASRLRSDTAEDAIQTTPIPFANPRAPGH